MVLDLLLILILLVFAVIGAFRGGIRMIFSVVATAAAFVVSLLTASAAAGWFYSAFISQRIVDAAAESIAGSAQQAAVNLFEIFPDFIASMLSAGGVDLNAAVSAASGDSVQAAACAVETAVSPIVISFMTIVFLVILFLLIRFLFSLFVNLIDRAFSIPVLRHLNRFLGIVCGLIQGVVVLLLAAAVIHSLCDGNPQPPTLLTRQYIDTSVLFVKVYDGQLLDSLLTCLV